MINASESQRIKQAAAAIRERVAPEKTVFVAMSGGVDSSVAAALLKAAGCRVVGVTMCFSIRAGAGKRPSCCGTEGIQDARRAAAVLGLPHHVMDFAADIEEFIIQDFIREYQNGRTPNPCMRCNQHLKFGSLFRRIKALGGDFVATGHYARLRPSPDGGCDLLEAVDEKKDQSYFLASVERDVLNESLFPLGDFTKDEIRALARWFSLDIADKPESQDICFVPAGGYKELLKKRLGPQAFEPGPFIDHTGRVVGRHRGLMCYTVGQRSGLGLSLGYPVYVRRLDPLHNAVHVAPLPYLFSTGFRSRAWHGLRWRPERTCGQARFRVRIRYNAPKVWAGIRLDDEGVAVEFDDPLRAVTPGQTAVFYDGEVVAGACLIDDVRMMDPAVESRDTADVIHDRTTL